MFATYTNQENRINDARTQQIASCERGNKIRRQVRIINVAVQDLVADAAAPGATAILERLRDQYDSPDLAAVSCAKELR